MHGRMAAPDWLLIRSFVEVVRLGSLTAAARALRTTQPTVGRHVRQLEEMAGDALFERHGTRMVPTERARDLFPWAERIAGEVTALGRAFALPVADPSGPVRITTSEVFGTHLLPELVAPLIDAHPGLTAEIVATDAVSDLVRRDADLAIRFVRPDAPDLVARRVGGVKIGLYAARSYLDRAGRPHAPADLMRHRILSSLTGDEVRVFAAAHDIGAAGASVPLRSDSLLVRRAAVRAGLGIGPMHVWLADADPVLERVLPALVVQTLPIWMVAHGDLSRSCRLRLVFDHLCTTLHERFGGTSANKVAVD